MRTRWALCLAMLCCWLPACSATTSPSPVNGHSALRDASRQGRYLIHELSFYTERYWARVAGRDTDLPPRINGHDEFAEHWTREMLANLRGLPVAVFKQSFPTPGFADLPAKRPGKNIIITIPGARHPDRAIVVGAHYDGEPTSKGSASDDASGSVLMLGLSRVLGDSWRRSGLPSMAVEFVLFDAEEQGLVGSNAYRFLYREGAVMPRPIVMIDEEQSGIGYPARPFGLRSRAPMPSFATVGVPVPLHTGLSIVPRQSALAALAQRLQAARPAIFAALHVVYPTLPFRGGSASVFTGGDEGNLKIGSSTICCSDNLPFDAMGVPTLTLSGDFGYYTRGKPSWSYPFDQPQDTIQAMACDTGGNPRPGAPLAAALTLPLAESIAVVTRYAPPVDSSGIAVLSGTAAVGATVSFQASGAHDPHWEFGDGGEASGSTVSHTYATAGTYHITVTSGAGSTTRHLVVHDRLPVFVSPIRGIKPPLIHPWRPKELRHVSGCP